MTSTINTSTTTTDAPCPWWCTSHYSVAGGEGEKDIGVHHRWLAAHRPEMAPQTAPPTTRLTVSEAVGEFNGETIDWAPGMSLAVFDSIPMSVPPAEARKLAAALIEGAEIVESYLTARCAVCGCAVVPEDADACVACQIRARQARMPRLVRASDEAQSV